MLKAFFYVAKRTNGTSSVLAPWMRAALLWIRWPARINIRDIEIRKLVMWCFETIWDIDLISFRWLKLFYHVYPLLLLISSIATILFCKLIVTTTLACAHNQRARSVVEFFTFLLEFSCRHIRWNGASNIPCILFLTFSLISFVHDNLINSFATCICKDSIISFSRNCLPNNNRSI